MFNLKRYARCAGLLLSIVSASFAQIRGEDFRERATVLLQELTMGCSFELPTRLPILID